MKIKLLGLLLGSMFIANFASAGILIDPYIGTGTVKTVFEIDGGDDDDDSGSGTFYGSRLGYKFLLFSAGIDYEKIGGGEDPDGEEIDITNTSLFVGVDLPILLRFWAEYMMSSNLESDYFDDFESFDFKSGYSLGVGFTGLPFVSLNVEVENINYEWEATTVDGTFSLVNTIFSLSFPIDI